MTSGNWIRVKELFEAALDLEPSERETYLIQNCDDQTREHVGRLVRNYSEAGNFLDEPAFSRLREAHRPEDSIDSETSHAVVVTDACAEIKDPMEGHRCGAYRLVTRIAQGGMGAVFLAVRADEEYQKQVAIKLVQLGPNSHELLHRFQNERQTLAGLDHPNVVKLLDGGSTPEGWPFLVMEYVEGSPIDAYCDEHKLSIDQRLHLFLKVCAAVQYAHEKSIVHRDLKPSNILVTADGTPRLLDFGIAKVLKSQPFEQMLLISQTGTRCMTPAYASPEQMQGRLVTTATDIYSLGVVLYELLTGRGPYQLIERTPSEIERAVCEQIPEAPSTALVRSGSQTEAPLRSANSVSRSAAVSERREREPESRDNLRRRLRGDLDNIVLKALRKEPELRYQSVQDLARDIEFHLSYLPISARRPSLRYRTAKLLRRHKGEAIAGALMLLVLLVAVALTRWEMRSTASIREAQPHKAQTVKRQSVAILGFQNLSAHPDTAWLSTALSEMLTTELSAGGKLRTIPGENVALAKVSLSLPETNTLSKQSLARISDKLGTDLVVLGSYLDVGDTGRNVRLDVRVQDAASGETVAVLVENGNEQALADLVWRAGATLREKLGLPAVSAAESQAARASLPSNPEATRLYAEGLARLRAFDPLVARDLFQKSVGADPSYALAHSALAEAWSKLGYEIRARDEAKKAFDLSSGLSREENLLVEAGYRQAARQWDRAIEIYRTLFNFFPDELDYGLRLAEVQAGAERGADSLSSVQALRKLPAIAEDPRIDLAEANAAAAMADYKRERNAASQAARKGESRGLPFLVAEARLREASSLLALGDPKVAKAAAEEARQVFAATGDRFGEARALLSIGDILQDQGDFKNSMSFLDQSMAIQKELGNREGEAAVEGARYSVLYMQSDLAGAKAAAMHRLDIARDIGRRTDEAKALINISELEDDAGELAQAKAHIEQASRIGRELGSPGLTAQALAQLGLLLIDNGDPTGGRKKLEEALELERRAGYKEGIGGDLLNLGELSSKHFDLPTAENQLSEALQIFTETGKVRGVAWVAYDLAEIAFLRGDLNAARHREEEALPAQDRLWPKIVAPPGRTLLASIASEQGRTGDAEHLARQAVEELRGTNQPTCEVNAHVALIEALLSEGRLQESQTVFESARKVAENANLDARLSVAVADAKVRAAAGKLGDAAKVLARALHEAQEHRYLYSELDASLALANVEIKSGQRAVAVRRLNGLEKKARAKGVLYYAEKAASLEKQEKSI